MDEDDEPEDNGKNLESKSYIDCCLIHSLRWFGKPLCKIKNYFCKYFGGEDKETGLNYCNFYYVKRKKSNE